MADQNSKDERPQYIETKDLPRRKPGSRPGARGLYKKEMDKQAAQLAKRGATDKEIAAVLGVSQVTLWKWKTMHPTFGKALARSKKQANDLVIAALFRSCIGYDAEETKIVKDGDNTIAVDVIKHYPPNQQAIEFWLCNRDPESWRKKQDLEMTGKDGENLIPSTIKVTYE